MSLELLDVIRELLGLRPLPDEVEPLAPSRKRCACGRRHRSKTDMCGKCSGYPCNWKEQKPSGVRARA